MTANRSLNMTLTEVLSTLKQLGTAQNVKVYKRHGVREPLYGVSFANLGVLKKKIKVDHTLALQLWKSGNADARHLATMIADPAAFTEKDVDSWAKDLTNYTLCDLVAGVVAKTPFTAKKIAQWTKSKDEWIGRTGWDLVAQSVINAHDFDDDFFEKQLVLIESTIHASKNFTRHAMNMALIAIGMRNAKLKKRAQAAAKRIGKVEVDHGETSCKTPDAYSYIEKAFAHHQAKLAKAGAKATVNAKASVSKKSAAPAKAAAKSKSTVKNPAKTPGRKRAI